MKQFSLYYVLIVKLLRKYMYFPTHIIIVIMIVFLLGVVVSLPASVVAPISEKELKAKLINNNELILNATTLGQSTNSEIWRPNIPYAGPWKVEMYIASHNYLYIKGTVTKSQRNIWSNLSISNTTQNTIPIAWNDNSNNETGFTTYSYSTFGGGWQVSMHPRMMADINGDGKDDSASGNYSFSKTYTVSTSKNGYSFSSISGKITDITGNPISGVIVSNGSTTTTTNTSGNYSFTGLTSGTYAVTPNKSGHSFSPVTKSVFVPPNANVTNQNFIGASEPSDGGD